MNREHVGFDPTVSTPYHNKLYLRKNDLLQEIEIDTEKSLQSLKMQVQDLLDEKKLDYQKNVTGKGSKELTRK